MEVSNDYKGISKIIFPKKNLALIALIALIFPFINYDIA